MYDRAIKSEIKLNVGMSLCEECTAANAHMVYEWTQTTVYRAVQKGLQHKVLSGTKKKEEIPVN